MLSIDKQILFLLTRASSITVQRFIEIYSSRGYSAQSVRNVLSRLKQLGYVETVARSEYAITNHGRNTLGTIQGKGFHYGEKWDGQWQAVMFEIPEADRTKRYHLRNALLSLGFAALYTNTYISPWDYTDEVRRLQTVFGLQDAVTQIKGSFQHFAITPERAIHMWNLAKVREAHEQKWQWFHEEYLPKLNKYREAKDPFHIFILYLELGEAMGELVLLDPMLPQQLLPQNWLGQQILGTFDSLFMSLHQEIPQDKYYYPLMKVNE